MINVIPVKWMETCPRCNGTGYIIDEENSNVEFYEDKIEGTLSTKMKKCPSCDGKGHTSEPIKKHWRRYDEQWV